MDQLDKSDKPNKSKAKSSQAEAKTAKSSAGDLESKTKEELYEMAKEQELEGRSNMTKDELVSALS